jgi:hypothetical protein
MIVGIERPFEGRMTCGIIISFVNWISTVTFAKGPLGRLGLSESTYCSSTSGIVAVEHVNFDEYIQNLLPSEVIVAKRMLGRWT